MNHPLALVVYNRPKHTKHVIDRLRPMAPRPMYVFSDGPKNEADGLQVGRVRGQATLIDWATPLQLWQAKNIGLAASILNAVNVVFETFETVIILEDDCLPGPHFMAFMSECLDRYKDDPQVLCVTGYTVNIPQPTQWDCYFMPRIETWGWATWRDKWALYRSDIAEAYRDALGKRVDLAKGGPDVPAMIQAKVEGHSDSWSPGWMLAGYLNEMYCVFPTVSHIQNIGMDGSGAHCGKSDRWITAITDEKPTRFPDGFVENKTIEDHVREYHAHY